jgi:diguanylate cyclase (GGDEF)-like protein
MELLLWRWSTTAQIASALLIAVFFVVLGRSLRRVETRPWVRAWLANLSALGVVVIFWYAQPESWRYLLIRVGYFFLKTLFVVLLAIGTSQQAMQRRMSRTVLAALFLYASVAAVIADTNDRIGVVQCSVIAAILGWAAIQLFRNPRPGFEWLRAGLALRSAFALVEFAAHLTRLVPNPWSESKGIGIFLACYSSFDTGIEWMIALGCVLTIHRTIQNELAQSNSDLLATQAVLQNLVDRDPLTGLLNRRALLPILEKRTATGARVLFFDLNDFKAINDAYGHQAGDECLRRFSRALQFAFGNEGEVFRYAGDEFVVLMEDVDEASIAERIGLLRESLRFEQSNGPEIRFSVGHAAMPVNGKADEALRSADAAMYREKSGAARRLRSV